MIAVDTNVLLRLIVDDDAEQHRLAKLFFAKRSTDDPAFVSLVVVSELVWLLTRRYAFPKRRVADLIDALLQSPDILFERPDFVRDAADLSRQSKVGFADVLIAQIAQSRECRAVCTFDKEAAKRIPGMELLA